MIVESTRSAEPGQKSPGPMRPRACHIPPLTATHDLGSMSRKRLDGQKVSSDRQLIVNSAVSNPSDFAVSLTLPGRASLRKTTMHLP